MPVKEIVEKIDFDELNIIYNDFVDYIKNNQGNYQRLLKSQKDLTKSSKLKILYTKFDTDLRGYLFIYEKMLDFMPKVMEMMEENQESFRQVSKLIKTGQASKQKQADYKQMEEVYLNSIATIFYKLMDTLNAIISILNEDYSLDDVDYNFAIQTLEKEIEKNKARTEFFNLNAKYFTEKINYICLLQNSIHALL